MEANLAANVRWDLSDLYKGMDDPALERDLQDADRAAKSFEAKYKPQFEALAKNSAAPFPLAELLTDYKRIVELCTKPGVFAHLYFAEKTDDARRGAFMQKIQDRLTDVQSHLIFWDVQWCRLDEGIAKRLMTDSGVAADRHYLENMRKYTPYTLSEAEEKILSIKSNTSGHAFSRLFDETINRIPFTVTLDGQKRTMTEAEVLSLLHSPARETRRAASSSLAEGLKANAHLLTFVYNMILADHRASMKIRTYKHPMDPRNLANETDLQSILALVKAVKTAYPMVSRFYKLKTALLKIDRMYDYDRYAPIAEAEEKITFKECETIVRNGYKDFSPKAAEVVGQFFDKRWIDAEIRPGKQGGGFCCQTTPKLHPYILVNYTGNVRDVMTVAHECGHGLHQYLAREVGILESDAPLTLAETASVFGEMLIFEGLMNRVKDPKEQLALLVGKIDDQFATVFRQIAMTDFELRCHEAGLKDGELAEEKMNELWLAVNTELYGKSVELTENYQHGWKYIPHFVHTPFYCYAYAFAQLFVLSLYKQYRDKPEGFTERYFKMLSLGGSKSPEEIAGLMNLDIHRPDFWQSGLSILEEMVGSAEKLAAVCGYRL